MSHRIRAVLLSLTAALAACQEGAREHYDGTTIRLATGALASASTDVSALADRDTTSGVEVAAAVTVSVDFDHDVEVRALKLYVKGAVQVSGLGAGKVVLSGDGEWVRHPLPGAVQARSFSVTLEPVDATAWLVELELWGGGRARVPRDLETLARVSANWA